MAFVIAETGYVGNNIVPRLEDEGCLVGFLIRNRKKTVGKALTCSEIAEEMS